ncbi:H(+)-ATPase [Lobosporangium transversale]|uniref:Plasma membrane ATPase n=1 Tax=Lobosporangium transversale TaxID=64571 RepID=A0A1Y2GYK4_9FUNG|nr:H(+)-ATPase [Lobosporangium transversale]ORZ27390.1 H(+)-ATPase [Lobosporangium transversale]|eukprot:XP_021885117.1 H(+)-ATPase [Lobosporangium transversale]
MVEKNGKGGNLQVEEHEHHEHTDQISPELEALLHTDPTQGLSDEEVGKRKAEFGPNELKEVKKNPILKFLGYFTGAIAYLIEVACIISAVVKDWLDFGIILALLLVNACIGFIEESKAESALDALRQTLALKTRCWRNGHLVELDTTELVPGDVIVLRLGDIVPADGRLLGMGASGEETNAELMIDQSALTGESLPVAKKKGDVVYSSSIVKQGQQMAIVTKTGADTFIGRAANLISITTEEGHFQKIINRIGNFLILITVVLVGIILVYQLVHFRGTPDGAFLTVLGRVLVLTVAAIPVGLPTVMSVTMAVGAKQLAAKQVIVKRLTAVEEMASVSVLCSDKTGTLTLNELTFDEPYLTNNYTAEDILLYSYLAAEAGANDPIELAVRTAAEEQLPLLQNRTHKHDIPGYKITSFLPFNPDTKLTQATVINKETNETFKVAKGAPQVIIRLVGGDDDAVRAVNALAKRGLRALGVARTRKGSAEEFELIGMISLIDPPRPDSAETIARCRHMGVDVKMVTGDQLIIAKEVAHRLGLTRVILDANHLADPDKSEEEVTEHCIRADGFAQVIPEHKYRVVELLQKRGIIVGMTGDGVNDAPALKKANVGIAVHGCTDAARSAADIVLLAPGLSTIVDGLLTSRAIFQRMRSYALYRITSTVHFLMFFFIVVMAYDWSLPARLLILICILNDLATLVIAVDNAQLSPHPDKWRIGQLITMSIVLGICLTALSFAHFFTFWKHFGYAPVHESEPEEYRKLESVMYLHISSAPHFVIFSTRLAGYFWENLPSPLFAAVIIGTQIIALLMVVFGGLTPKIPFSQAIVVLLISFAYFIALDVVKVQLFKIWSFELTAAVVRTPARRKKLAEKKARKIQQERVWNSIDHIREIILKLKALEALNEVPKGEGQTIEDPEEFHRKEQEKREYEEVEGEGKDGLKKLDAMGSGSGADEKAAQEAKEQAAAMKLGDTNGINAPVSSQRPATAATEAAFNEKQGVQQ